MSGKVLGKFKGEMTKSVLGLSTSPLTLPFLLGTCPFTPPGAS
jgi:hypothetical protein